MLELHTLTSSNNRSSTRRANSKELSVEGRCGGLTKLFLSMKKIQLTKDGYLKLQIELKDLIENKKPLAVERLHIARAMGDLSENSEYTASKDDLSFVEGRIQEIEEILKQAEVVQNHNGNHLVDVGVSITVEADGKTEQFQIVGEFEADPLNKKLSHTSPIGKALLGKRVGDLVEVEIPAGKIKYKIVEVK